MREIKENILPHNISKAIITARFWIVFRSGRMLFIAAIEEWGYKGVEVFGSTRCLRAHGFQSP